jgi:hypothetical protein
VEVTGKPGGVHEFAQEPRRLGPRIDDAAAGVEDGPLGRLHEGDERLDGGGVGVAAGGVAEHLGLGRGVGAGGELDVLGDVHEDGAGAAGARDVERLVQRLGQAVGFLDQPVGLGAGAGDAHGVRLLEGVRADHEGGDLAGEDDDGDGVHQRVGEAGDGVGGAGARGDERHADLAGGAGVALGGVDGGLLVADEDVVDVVLLKSSS